MCFTFQSQKQVVYNIPSHSAYLIFKKTGNGSVRNACCLRLRFYEEKIIIIIIVIIIIIIIIQSG